MKKILVLSYSQTGQLSDIISNFTKPLKENDDIEVVIKNIIPKQKFPFPWKLIPFMDAFPESVYLDGCELEPIEDDENDYDLVILPYQVWFLSPSIPIAAFLKSEYAKKKLKDKPVITLIGCRNMWVMAQEKVKSLLDNLGATLIDNVVLIDQGNSIETFITTPRWMLSGKKDSYLGMSEAGVSDKDIKNCSRFGRALVYALKNDEEKKKTSLLQGLEAVEVNVKLIKSEKIGTKSFHIWGKLIKKIGKMGNPKRVPVILLYLLFLILMIVTVVPINMIIQTIIRKINKEKILQQKTFYELPSGSGSERMKEFL